MIINARFLTQQLTGVQRYAIEISRELLKLNSEIIFVSPKNIIHQEIAKEFNVKVIGRKTGYYWEQIELPSYLKKNHKGALLLNFANVAPINYKNKIVTIHDVAPFRNPEWFSRKFSLAFKYLMPLVARTSLKILTGSEYSKDEINVLLKVDRSKITVIPNGVNQVVSIELDDVSEIINSPYILSVSSPSPRKNFVKLIEAFLKVKRADIKLVIVGSENRLLFNKYLNNKIHDNPSIIFTGHINDQQLVALYQKAELFVYPSLYEGFGLPPLEAMVAKCPCAVSRITSLPEVCGNAVEYFDPYDSDDIANTLDKLLTNPKLREELIDKGLKRIQKFTWGKSASSYMKIINEFEKL